ncbi:hypothetical protein GALL_456100 [mine drainage metagenome]|uniref:Uncharacterized protein n=1 Tax=mine drainage metagenome TaxID=410659 RepID=A0A1J5PMM9_9ZZZZ
MHAHRDAVAKRGQQVSLIDRLFVTSVPGFVDGRVEAVERLFLHHPRRDAHIVTRAGGERVDRQIKPSPVPVIAERLRQIAGDAHLAVSRELAGQGGGLRRTQNTVRQRDQSRPQPVKHRADAFRRRTGFIIVQKRVIEIAVACQRRRLFPLQRHDAGKGWQEIRHLFGTARPGPDALRDGCHTGDFGRQCRRNAGLFFIGAADVAKLRALDLILRFRRLQPLANARIGAAGVEDALDRAGLVTTLIGGAARHHGFLIPAKAARNLPQRLGIALKGHEV